MSLTATHLTAFVDSSSELTTGYNYYFWVLVFNILVCFSFIFALIVNFIINFSTFSNFAEYIYEFLREALGKYFDHTKFHSLVS